MASYMVTIALPPKPPEEFFAQIPAQRAYVNDLFVRGVLVGYALSHDRSRLWATVTADSREALDEIVDGLPLRRYMDVHVEELMFHQRSPYLLQIVSLN